MRTKVVSSQLQSGPSVSTQRTHRSSEVDEIKWLEPDQLSRMSEAYRVRLLDELDDGPPHVRAHDSAQLVEHRR